MSDLEFFEESWTAMQCSAVRYPKRSHPVTAQPFLAELRYLSEITREYGGAAFSEAIAEIKALKLIGKDGQWRDRWKSADDPDPAEGDDRYAVHLVAERIAAGDSESRAVAYVVWDLEMPGDNFRAAWARLRALYYAAYPHRPRKKRGRPRGS